MVLLVKPCRKVKIKHILYTFPRHNTLLLILGPFKLPFQTLYFVLHRLLPFPFPMHGLGKAVSFPDHLLFLLVHGDPNDLNRLLHDSELLLHRLIELFQLVNSLPQLIILLLKLHLGRRGLVQLFEEILLKRFFLFVFTFQRILHLGGAVGLQNLVPVDQVRPPLHQLSVLAAGNSAVLL